MKTCSKCSQEKMLDAFGRDKRNRDGRASQCKLCCQAEQVARRAANPDKYRARDRARHARNPEPKRERQREWSRDNAEKAAASSAAWRAANPEHARELGQQRKAREKAAFVESVSNAFIWDRDGGVCHICGTLADPDNWHLEHIVPLARGGAHSYQNAAVSHPSCNLRKSDGYVKSSRGLLGSFVLRPVSCAG